MNAMPWRPVSVSADADDPIDFILGEHLAHRAMCAELMRVARSDKFEPEVLAGLADFVRFDLTLHVIDEEEDFFPLVRERCPPEDEVNALLERLTAEHAQDKILAVGVRDVINQCLIEAVPPREIKGGAEALIAFAEHEKRHMTLENAVLIPLARRWLDAADRALLARKFRARRGAAAPGS